MWEQTLHSLNTNFILLLERDKVKALEDATMLADRNEIFKHFSI